MIHQRPEMNGLSILNKEMGGGGGGGGGEKKNTLKIHFGIKSNDNIPFT